MIGRCEVCPERERLLAEKDRTIERMEQTITLLTEQLEGREKTMLAVVNQAALHARFPRGPAPVGPGVPLKKVLTRPADFAAQVFDPEAEERARSEFRLLDVLNMAPPKASAAGE